MSFQEKIAENKRKQNAMTSLEVTVKFLRSFFYGAAELDEAHQRITELAFQSPQTFLRYLLGIEKLLTDPPKDSTLAKIVAWDANWVLEDPSDEGAERWLQEQAQMLRDVLGEVANSDAMTPFHVTVDFLLRFCLYASNLDEVRQQVARLASEDPQAIQRYITGIERLLAEPPPADKAFNLANIVAWEANWVLEDPSNEGAEQWLQEQAQMLRDVLEEVANS